MNRGKKSLVEKMIEEYGELIVEKYNKGERIKDIKEYFKISSATITQIIRVLKQRCIIKDRGYIKYTTKKKKKNNKCKTCDNDKGINRWYCDT